MGNRQPRRFAARQMLAIMAVVTGRTWDIDQNKLLDRFEPQPNAYYQFAMLSRFLPKHSGVLATQVDASFQMRDRKLVAAALRTPGGNTTVILWRNGRVQHRATGYTNRENGPAPEELPWSTIRCKRMTGPASINGDVATEPHTDRVTGNSEPTGAETARVFLRNAQFVQERGPSGVWRAAREKADAPVKRNDPMHLELRPIPDPVNHTDFRLAVRCADCGATLDTVTDPRTATWKAGVYASHRCSAAEKAGQSE
jgi:hypothetical protein